MAASFCQLEKANDKREGKRENRMEVKKKTKKGIFHIVFSRTALVFLLLIFQVVLLFEMFTSLVKYAPVMYLLLLILGSAVVIYIINRRKIRHLNVLDFVCNGDSDRRNVILSVYPCADWNTVYREKAPGSLT